MAKLCPRGKAAAKRKFVVENELLYPEGCAIKYIIRHRDKGKKQDLLKAIHFIEMIIERDYGETDI